MIHFSLGFDLLSGPFNDYASEVQKLLWDAGIFADVDVGSDTLKKKIRNGEVAQYNFLLVVGEEERDARTVNVRNRDDVGTKARTPTIALDVVLAELVALKKERRLVNRIQVETEAAGGADSKPVESK